MSRIRRPALALSALALAAGTAFLVTRTMAAQTNRPDQWKKVEEAVKKGLPKTAIEELEPIIASAMKDKAYPEAIKAIAKKIALEGNIQGNKPEEKITRMQAEIAKAPAEMKPVMQTAPRRTGTGTTSSRTAGGSSAAPRTAAAPGNDFTTWDLPRLFAEIDKHFTAALADEKELRGHPRSPHYDALLEKGSAAGRLPAHALRLPGVRRARLLHLARAGRGQGRRTPSRSTPPAPSSPRPPSS